MDCQNHKKENFPVSLSIGQGWRDVLRDEESGYEKLLKLRIYHLLRQSAFTGKRNCPGLFSKIVIRQGSILRSDWI
jgi:hypothetical protein